MLKSRTNPLAQGTDESLEVVRRRALHRLVGSLVLVTLGIVGFPLVFDTEPRSLESGLRVEIPSKDAVTPIAQSPAIAAGETATAESTPAENSGASASKAAQPEKAVAEIAATQTQPAELPRKSEKAASPQPKATAAADTSQKSSPTQSTDDAARALAILQGKGDPASAAVSAVRWVVQVGSYGDPSSVSRVRSTLKKAGFESYTQNVETSKGTLTRVRVGPFTKESDAAEVVRKLRDIGLATSLLKL